MIERTTSDAGIVELYPFASGELTKDNFLTPRIEVFPEWFRDDGNTDGKRVRFAGQWFSQAEWEDYIARVSEGMRRAFEIEDATISVR